MRRILDALVWWLGLLVTTTFGAFCTVVICFVLESTFGWVITDLLKVVITTAISLIMFISFWDGYRTKRRK